VTEFLTRDIAFGQLLEAARRAAGTQAGIFITGESGTGKNRLAGFIHEHSPRQAGPLIQVPCANLPVELLESELFGHEPGAFTGAGESRPGRFELADGGSLYLDEIQELTLPFQAKVLRAIQEKQFEKLGGSETLSVDVRIIASSQEDPEGMVEAGRLRSDLFYRMNVVRLHVPPLRERAVDIPHLAEEFLAMATERHGLTSGRQLAPEVEAAYIDEVLARTGGNKSAAARILGIHRKTLHEKLRQRNPDTDS